MELRNAISQICRHFAQCEEEHPERVIAAQPDYVLTDTEDLERFLKGRREGKKRARALLDFDKRDPDDLGFQKNDLITILSDKEEHCWIGEVNGESGWFPAKFVEVLDFHLKIF